MRIASPQYLSKRGIECDRIHGNRSQAQRTRALDDFKKGRIRALVATDIAARGIDVEALSHVVNFDVPHLPEDYIHRVGRTARAQATGEALTFCSPQESRDLHQIERAVGKRLPRRQLADFDHDAPAIEKLEIPIAERIAAIRARKAEERARSRAKADRQARRPAARPAGRRPAAGRAQTATDGSQAEGHHRNGPKRDSAKRSGPGRPKAPQRQGTGRESAPREGSPQGKAAAGGRGPRVRGAGRPSRGKPRRPSRR